MDTGTPPRAAKKRRRLDGGAGAGAGISMSTTVSSAADGARSPSPLIPPTPPFGSPPPRPTMAHPNVTVNGNNAHHTRNKHASDEALAEQMLTLYTRLDDLRDDLARNYEAERKARMDAHDAAQRQLTVMQGMLEGIARDYARSRRRSRLERRLFGVGNEGSNTTNSYAGAAGRTYDGDIDFDNMGYDHDDGDLEVDMQDANIQNANAMDLDDDMNGRAINLNGSRNYDGADVDTRKYAYARRGSSETLEMGPAHDDEDEDSSIPRPRARNRLRRRVLPTNSPSINGIKTADASDSEPSSRRLRALHLSPGTGTHRRFKRAPRRRLPSPQIPFSSPHRTRRVVPDSQSQGATADAASTTADSFSLTLSQASVPSNRDDDDDTYRGSTTESASDADAEATEADPDPDPEPELELDPNDIDLDLDLPARAGAAPFTARPRSPPPLDPTFERITPANRPRRKTAHVNNYYEWERYIIRSDDAAPAPAPAPYTSPLDHNHISKPRLSTAAGAGAGTQPSFSPRQAQKRSSGGVSGLGSPLAENGSTRHTHTKHLSLG
ncbi:hypothetical protein Dda_3140 [Drechslerella dactyloides]|uniref:Uncharacterized protein n=1 Tax=Drechslerella dactyloides TaxID=74499 RepID=A0AAD6J0T3_DREDA|nr:hypothetical protein Dda_3140 [Drechslerella dactyloides]